MHAKPSGWSYIPDMGFFSMAHDEEPAKTTNLSL